jgi:hypothetical protein
MNTTFSPVGFTQIRGVFNKNQLCLATQTIPQKDGTILATFSDNVLRYNPEIHDVPREAVNKREAVNVSGVQSPIIPAERVSLIGRKVHVMLFEDIPQRNGKQSRRFKSEFRGTVTDENSAFIRVLSELDSGNPHKVSEREWFSKFNNRLMEITISE